MSISVDARGLDCPKPVLVTKKALDGLTSGIITTIVDNAVAKENVAKFAAASGCGVSITDKNGEYYVRITKNIAPSQHIDDLCSEEVRQELTYLITQDTMGHGSKDLGSILIKSFFFTLGEKELLPRTIIFINSAVNLTVETSPVLEHLTALAQRGVKILSCGTCLDYYSLKDRLAVGEITNMYTVVEEITTARKTITI